MRLHIPDNQTVKTYGCLMKYNSIQNVNQKRVTMKNNFQMVYRIAVAKLTTVVRVIRKDLNCKCNDKLTMWVMGVLVILPKDVCSKILLCSFLSEDYLASKVNMTC